MVSYNKKTFSAVQIAENLRIGNDVLIFNDQWAVISSADSFTCQLDIDENGEQCQIYPKLKIRALDYSNYYKTERVNAIRKILNRIF